MDILHQGCIKRIFPDNGELSTGFGHENIITRDSIKHV